MTNAHPDDRFARAGAACGIARRAVGAVVLAILLALALLANARAVPTYERRSR